MKLFQILSNELSRGLFILKETIPKPDETSKQFQPSFPLRMVQRVDQKIHQTIANFYAFVVNSFVSAEGSIFENLEEQR